MLGLRPWIAEVQMNAFDFAWRKHRLDPFDISAKQREIWRMRLPFLFPNDACFLACAAKQLIVHVNADKVDVRIPCAHLADETAFTHAQLYINRLIVSEKLTPFSFVGRGIKHNQLRLSF